MPSGTTASASSVYAGLVAADAIDGNINTYWNAPTSNGSLTIVFPSSVEITGVRIASQAGEQIVITGNGSTSTLATTTTSPTSAAPVFITGPVAIPAGGYTSLTFTASATSAGGWLAINEVSLLTSACP